MVYIEIYQITQNIKIKTHKKIKPWITNGLINSIKNRDKLKKQIKNIMLTSKITINCLEII